MPVTPLKPRIWCAYLKCFRSALSYVGKQSATNRYTPEHSFWPSLSWNANGFPSFNELLFGGPPDYGSLVFGRATPSVDGSDPQPDLSEIADAVRADDDLYAFLGGAKFYDTNSRVLIKYSVDRFVHLNQKFEVSDEEAFELYEPLEHWFSQRSLPIEIVIPILAVQFTENSYSFSDGIDLVKLSDAVQQARAPSQSHAYGHHPLVQAVATHAFKIGRYNIENPHFLFYADLHPPALRDKVGLLFACLRLTAQLATGYAQVLGLPVGWTRSYAADRVGIISESVKVYPSVLEDGCWNVIQPPVLTADEISQCSNLYSLLEGLCLNHKSMAVAIRRFNNSYLRQNEEDSIIDVLIALECLLSDKGTTEMTHKLALRVATLLSLCPQSTLEAGLLFKEVKGVYAFRSAIVHGDVIKMQKEATIEREGQSIPTLQIAREHLCNVITTLAANPEYLEPAILDALLLKGLESHVNRKNTSTDTGDS